MMSILWMSVIACVKYGPVQVLHSDLEMKLVMAEQDPWTKECAPAEMAAATSHKVFAEMEFRQGATIRAEEHLTHALENVDQALTIANECRPRDNDGDGILDHIDQCPKVPETFNDYQDDDGCPEKDTDGDKIFDDQDQCSTVAEDYDDFQDDDGCPEYDNDKDGLVDTQDQCPNEPEDYDAFQDDDGCPEDLVDTDNDGVMDDVDRCKTQPETKNGYMDADGCPDAAPKGVRVTDTEIVIEEKIYFETAKAIILPKSYSILNSVAQAMKDYDRISVEVQGHTDSDGSASYNRKLSDQRANSVRQYLIDAGISEERLQAKGYGEDKPIDTNATAEGKERNRRVEFKIVGGMK